MQEQGLGPDRMAGMDAADQSEPAAENTAPLAIAHDQHQAVASDAPIVGSSGSSEPAGVTPAEPGDVSLGSQEVQDAEETAAALFPTEFAAPPSEDAAVHPASEDWQVAPEQPSTDASRPASARADAGALHMQAADGGAAELTPSAAPSSYSAPPAQVGQVGPGEESDTRVYRSSAAPTPPDLETGEQVAQERLSQPGHYEAQQIVVTPAETFAADTPPHQAVDGRTTEAARELDLRAAPSGVDNSLTSLAVDPAPASPGYGGDAPLVHHDTAPQATPEISVPITEHYAPEETAPAVSAPAIEHVTPQEPPYSSVAPMEEATSVASVPITVHAAVVEETAPMVVSTPMVEHVTPQQTTPYSDGAATQEATPEANAPVVEHVAIEETPYSGAAAEEGVASPGISAPVAERVGLEEATPEGSVAEPTEPLTEARTPEPAAPQRPITPRRTLPPQRSLGDLSEGEMVTGRVRTLADFGAFVDLGLRERKDGLIHVSQLADRRIGHPSEVVQVGQEVTVRVVTVDRERGRVGLSLRPVIEPRPASTEPRQAPWRPLPVEPRQTPEQRLVSTEQRPAAAESQPAPSPDSAAPVEAPVVEEEVTLQSLLSQYSRQESGSQAPPQRGGRRSERDRQERDALLRRLREEGQS